VEADTTATLDEPGYQEVASRKSNEEMNSFVRDVVVAHGGKITDKDALHNMVPNYSGMADVQSYWELVKELKHADWIEKADWTDVDEKNEPAYQAVASRKSNEEMNSFIRDVVVAHGGKITDKDALHNMVPNYSGMAGVQSYWELVKELKHADWIEKADWTDVHEKNENNYDKDEKDKPDEKKGALSWLR